jgi:hypothetical protein
MNMISKLSIAGASSVAAGFAFPVDGAVAGPVGIAAPAAVALPMQVENVHYRRHYYGGYYCPTPRYRTYYTYPQYYYPRYSYYPSYTYYPSHSYTYPSYGYGWGGRGLGLSIGFGGWGGYGHRLWW